jgi:hypothetical protein
MTAQLTRSGAIAVLLVLTVTAGPAEAAGVANAGKGPFASAVAQYVEMVPTGAGDKPLGVGTTSTTKLAPRIEKQIHNDAGKDAAALTVVATSSAYGAPTAPAAHPTAKPKPTSTPSSQPTSTPSSPPTSTPTSEPTSQPTTTSAPPTQTPKAKSKPKAKPTQKRTVKPANVVAAAATRRHVRSVPEPGIPPASFTRGISLLFPAGALGGLWLAALLVTAAALVFAWRRRRLV